MTINYIEDSDQQILRYQAIGVLEKFHALTMQMLPSLDELDEEAFQHSLTLLKDCNVLSQLLNSKNVIRGKKDILLSFAAIMCAQLTKSGLPTKQTLSLEALAVEKVELNSGDLNFDLWLTELANNFFQALKKYRTHLFVDKAEQIKDYIQKNARKNIQLKNIAQDLRISQQSLNIIFKRKYNMTIRQYAIQLKMAASKKMLANTQFTMKDIAKYLSFADESYFVFTFSKTFGITPAKYRHQCTGKKAQLTKSVES